MATDQAVAAKTTAVLAAASAFRLLLVGTARRSQSQRRA